MNKKILATLTGAVMAATAMGAPTVLADDSVTLVYAELNSMDSTDGMYASFFKDKVEELTNGSVKIDIQASGVMGNESDVLDGMISMSGTVDIARVSSYAFGNYKCNKSALLGLPFVFESRDHFWKFANSEVGEEVLAELSDNALGVTGLFYIEDGFRSFFFKDPVETIDDLADKKIRVSQDQIMTDMVEALKASPTVVSFNELYTSLQSGVVDGAEQPIAAYATNAFNEVAPNVILDEHTMSIASVVIADSSLDKLSEDQIEALKEAGKQTEEYCAKISAEEEEKCKADLEEKGVNFVEVEDKTPWRDACADVISQFTSGVEDT
ncbi:MAG: TRAP transporter substrate-binding protein, partial [Lachnospiraceae bacterium]|nr:TRAP transporter substrate-binding protein [Lachnospiraceae bacterium]